MFTVRVVGRELKFRSREIDRGLDLQVISVMLLKNKWQLAFGACMKDPEAFVALRRP